MIPFSDIYQRFLRDESYEEGVAESISFPESEEDVVRILEELRRSGTPGNITCQGSCTGVRGLAVPHGGHIINCSKMNRIIKMEAVSETEAFAVVEPGVTLEELNPAIARTFGEVPFFWPPSPTEATATIGGIAVTGAHGMNICHYGATSGYVSEVRWIAPDGTACVKAGSELGEVTGQNGVITALKLRLVRKPDEIWGAAFFFQKDAGALRFADYLRSAPELLQSGDAWIASTEYFDAGALALASCQKADSPSAQAIPDVPDGAKSLIYLEVEGASDAVEQMVFELIEPAETCGCDPDMALAFAGRGEAEKMHGFRHAILEAVSDHTARMHAEDARITRQVIGFTGGERLFSEAARHIQKELERCDIAAAVLAHIRDGVFEINILANHFEAVLRSKELFT